MLVMTLRGTALAQIWLMTLGFQCELCDDESLVRNLAVAWHSGSTIRFELFQKEQFLRETGDEYAPFWRELHEL